MPLTLSLDVLDRFNLCMSLLVSEDAVCSWNIQTIGKSTEASRLASTTSAPCIILEMTRTDSVQNIQIETFSRTLADSTSQTDTQALQQLEAPIPIGERQHLERTNFAPY